MCESHDAIKGEQAILDLLDKEGEATFNFIGRILSTTGICCRMWAFRCLLHLKKEGKISGHYHYRIVEGCQDWTMFWHIRQEGEEEFLGVVPDSRNCKYVKKKK